MTGFLIEQHDFIVISIENTKNFINLNNFMRIDIFGKL